jgi:hypothetical protein
MNDTATPSGSGPVDSKTATFQQIFAAEYRDLHARCSSLPPPKDDGQVPTVANNLVGISLSGGGNRSSTFCLGVLQAINARGILRNVNYLSTVSGGGYVGTAVTIGMSENGEFPFGKTGEDVGETPETRHLRDNSRYLMQNGIPSVVSAAAIYLRGIVMNSVILLPLLLVAAAVLVLLKPNTSALFASWGWMGGLPEFIRQAAMPLSVLATFVVLALLVLYAIGVSVVPIISLEARRRIARVAAAVMIIFGAILFFEIHVWLLRYVFAMHGIGTPVVNSASPPQFQISQTFVSSAAKFAAWATPLVVAILPFLKSIAQKAVSSKSDGWSEVAARWGSRLLLVVVGLVVPVLFWLTVLQLAYWGIAIAATADGWPHAPEIIRRVFEFGNAIPPFQIGRHAGWVYLLAAAALMLFWPFLNVNANSLHQLYRDRLGSAFLTCRSKQNPEAVVPADNFALSRMDTTRTPYHLLNAALNVPGSKFANRRGRNADFFLFSRRFVGSEATGYVSTELAEQVNDGLNIGTAMAISGAAAAPNMGMASMRPLSPTIAFLNVRLGRWLRHPLDTIRYSKRSALALWWSGKPGPLFLLREAFSKSGSDIVNPSTEEPVSSRFVFLTDGGHIENLGVYELLRRRCALIIAVDGEADPEMTGGSLVQLERFARIDLGTRIVMDWKPIGERSRAVSDEVKKMAVSRKPGPHVALGLIDYPGVGNGPREKGVLVYIKSSMSGDENDYVLSYKATNSAFPHETTMDQLFTEEQFEAYRALGEHIAGRFLNGSDIAVGCPELDPKDLKDRLELLFRTDDERTKLPDLDVKTSPSDSAA